MQNHRIKKQISIDAYTRLLPRTNINSDGSPA